jgi:hypothetical protein
LAAWDGKTVAKVIPERDFELGAGFGEAEEGIVSNRFQSRPLFASNNDPLGA